MELFDTHCHIHFPDYELNPEEVMLAAKSAGVTRLMCVGCTLVDSQSAIKMAQAHDNIWASIGLHPHEGSGYVNDDAALAKFVSLAAKPKVVAIGETGLDYHYMHSPKEDQAKLLRFQLDVAIEHNLPLIFHVREAFDDFWRIFDAYRREGFGIKGVVHSFSAHNKELDEILARDLFVGLNGIVTFAKDEQLLAAVKTVPLDKLLLETDAPFLTPTPFRGKVCEPKYMRITAEFLSQLRGESLEEIAHATTQNAVDLFDVKGANG